MCVCVCVCVRMCVCMYYIYLYIGNKYIIHSIYINEYNNMIIKYNVHNIYICTYIFNISIIFKIYIK